MRVCVTCGSGPVSADWTCPACGAHPGTIDDILALAPTAARDEVGFRSSYFAELAALEQDSFWFRARNDLIIWAMRRWFPAARSILELGCGTGFVLSALQAAYPEAELTGSELLAAGLPYAKARVPSATFLQLDARHIPFRQEFDVIGAFDVIEHIPEDLDVLAQMASAVRPGGGVVITVPQHPAVWSRQDEYAHHVRRYIARDLRHKLVASGLDVVALISFVSLLLPAMLVSRRWPRSSSKHEGDAMEAIPVAPPLDAVLSKVMSIERALIRSGVRFPAGGSLLAVAHRPGQEQALS